MIKSMFGNNTLVGMLRGGLDRASIRHRTIAGNVANAVQSSSSGDFAGQLNAEVSAQRSQADLEHSMVALADNQIRYETTAKLLQKTYAQWRTAIRDRG